MEEKNNQTNEENVNNKPQEEKKVKQKKNLLPWVSNDDLVLIVSAIILVLGTFNIEKIYSLFSKHKFQVDSSEKINKNENKEQNSEKKEENKERILICTKKNSINNYVLDINYNVKYNEKVYQMTYEIKAVDLDKLELEENEKINRENLLSNLILSYENYKNHVSEKEGSEITDFKEEGFVQIIDFSKITKEVINGSDKEIVFFELNDTYENIKKNFEDEGYTCE